jgi:hypothetical protein
MKDPISVIVPQEIADALEMAEQSAVRDDGAVSISIERETLKTFIKDAILVLGPGALK